MLAAGAAIIRHNAMWERGDDEQDIVKASPAGRLKMVAEVAKSKHMNAAEERLETLKRARARTLTFFRSTGLVTYQRNSIRQTSLSRQKRAAQTSSRGKSPHRRLQDHDVGSMVNGLDNTRIAGSNQ